MKTFQKDVDIQSILIYMQTDLNDIHFFKTEIF